MSRRFLSAAFVGGLLALVTPLLSVPAAAQIAHELLAKGRVFTDVGPGFRALKRRPEAPPGGSPAPSIGTTAAQASLAVRYYVLAAPGGVVVYDAAGKRLGQVPAPAATPDRSSKDAAKEAALVFGDDLDVDATGRVYVADRGASTVKVYAPDGTFARSIPADLPTSVVVLSGGEIGVATMKSPHLVTVFDERGKVMREFGDPADVAERSELNRFLNIGRLASDAAGHLYYGFTYLPEPTVRKYDRNGYGTFDLTLTTLEFQPAAQAARREIAKQERGGTPRLRPTITAIGVDPATEDLWVALGAELLHFDREGNRLGDYRTFTPEGARLESTSILVEPDRLLLGNDPLGIYEFPRPDKTKP